MKTINWKIMNISFWLELALSYILPFKVIDDFQYQVGFPIPFILVYDAFIRVNPLMSMQLNPLALLVNVAIIYLVISFFTGVYKKIKQKRIK